MGLTNKIFVFISIYIILPNFIYADEAKGGMPQLDPSSYSSQTFWLLLIFIILFLFINFHFFPKIIDVRANREEAINNSLEKAKKNNEEATILKEKLDQDLSNAKSKAEEIISESIQKSRIQFENKISILNNELEKKIGTLTEELEADKKKILNNIDNYSYEISNIIYNNLLNEKKEINLNEFKELNKN